MIKEHIRLRHRGFCGLHHPAAVAIIMLINWVGFRVPEVAVQVAVRGVAVHDAVLVHEDEDKGVSVTVCEKGLWVAVVECTYLDMLSYSLAAKRQRFLDLWRGKIWRAGSCCGNDEILN